MQLFLAITLPIVVATAAAVLFDWRWPKASILRLRGYAGAMGLLANIVLLALWFVALSRSGRQPSPSPDAEGMVIASLMILSPVILAVSLLLGNVSAHVTLRYLRDR
jgi:hypothetical protein